LVNHYSIGYAIAEKLGQDGAKVVVSSRKQKNVDEAVKKMKEQNLEVFGTVCHVAKSEDRTNLIKQVINKISLFLSKYPSLLLLLLILCPYFIFT